MYAETYKKLGYIIIALGFLVAIITAFEIGFTLVMFFSTALSGIMAGFLFIGLGDVIQTLLEIREKMPDKVVVDTKPKRQY